MADKICEICGTALTAWNAAWGTQKCSRCAKGRSPEAKKLLELKDLTKDELHTIAAAQRLVIASVFAYLLAIVVYEVAAASASLDLRPLGYAAAIFAMVAIYRLATALRRVSPLTWSLGMLLPIVGLILLLVLSQKATGVLKAAGVHVGLLGARLKDIA